MHTFDASHCSKTRALGGRCHERDLQQISRLAILYADSGSNRFFPIASGENPTAHESLNVLVAAFPDLEPRLFMCRSYRGAVAERDGDGRFVLDETNCSYAWTKERLSPTDRNRPLASCKHVRAGDQRSGHRGGMNVVYTDGRVEFVSSSKLDSETGLPEGLVR